jgi:hypothetical protein
MSILCVYMYYVFILCVYVLCAHCLMSAVSCCVVLCLTVVLLVVSRDHWLQLNAMWQVMKEMADLSRQSDQSLGQHQQHNHNHTATASGGSGSDDRVLLTSARSSKLTVLLAPLLQGNTKVSGVFLFLCVLFLCILC